MQLLLVDQRIRAVRQQARCAALLDQPNQADQEHYGRHASLPGPRLAPPQQPDDYLRKLALLDQVLRDTPPARHQAPLPAAQKELRGHGWGHQPRRRHPRQPVPLRPTSLRRRLPSLQQHPTRNRGTLPERDPRCCKASEDRIEKAHGRGHARRAARPRHPAQPLPTINPAGAAQKSHYGQRCQARALPRARRKEGIGERHRSGQQQHPLRGQPHRAPPRLRRRDDRREAA